MSADGPFDLKGRRVFRGRCVTLYVYTKDQTVKRNSVIAVSVPKTSTLYELLLIIQTTYYYY